MAAEQPSYSYDPTRLDRIEALLPILARMHREFDEEYAKLLLKFAASAALFDNLGKPPEAAG